MLAQRLTVYADKGGPWRSSSLRADNATRKNGE